MIWPISMASAFKETTGNPALDSWEIIPIDVPVEITQVKLCAGMKSSVT